MITKEEMDLIVQKTEDLCVTVLSQPSFKELKEMVDRFTSNQDAIAQYNRVAEKQQILRQKQRSGAQLTQEEINDFEQEDYSLYANEITRQFLYAQREFGKVHKLVSQYVVKTIELNRLPDENDLNSGGCGCGSGGCGGGSCGCGSGESCGCGCQ